MSTADVGGVSGGGPEQPAWLAGNVGGACRVLDGEEFDASWDRGEPLSFQLGGGQVIAGWDQGLQGMRVGGRRQLVIALGLAYGDRGAGRSIAPGETLIFVCDLVSV